jgi:hypothetical protein
VNRATLNIKPEPGRIEVERAAAQYDVSNGQTPIWRPLSGPGW